MKKDKSTIILVIVFILGLSVILYPGVSDYWNSRTQTRMIVDYEAVLHDMKDEDYSELFDAADRYNEELFSLVYPLADYKSLEGYNQTLLLGNTGVIAYLDIDKINVELPIYHGTGDAVLNKAVGHVEGTSLPVGGESTHCVLSAHRGLPSAKLFTDLDKLEPGDTFTITVLNQTLTYEVDKISIVKPTEVDNIQIFDGEDHCTLSTCTPYGVNTHRLLVRGTRIETMGAKPHLYIQAQAFKIDPLVVTPIVAIPMLLLLLVWLLVKYKKKP